MPHMDSGSGEILAFKTCCGLSLRDQNLEILVKNEGETPRRVQSRFEAVAADGVHRVDNLLPSGVQDVPPGQSIAFYVQMDEEIWKRTETLRFFEEDGKVHTVTRP